MVSNKNLCQMLIFAFRLWGLDKHIRPGQQDLASPLDVLALVLNDQIVTAEKRGLYRNYQEITETTFQPRGKILMSETLRFKTTGSNRVVINTDELSNDNTVNQSIRWAINFLLTSGAISAETKKSLKNSDERLGVISYIPRPSRSLSTDLLQARRPEYRIALSIVTLLASSQQIDPDAESHMGGLISNLDEVLKSQLFESFIREFYRYHLTDAHVTGRNMTWSFQPASLEPLMRTDINIERAEQILVIDTKYYQSVLSTRKDTGPIAQPKIKSTNLYQIFTYMAYTSMAKPDHSISGLLLYPENGTTIDHTIPSIQGPIRAKTINFMLGWPLVESELLGLVTQ